MENTLDLLSSQFGSTESAAIAKKVGVQPSDVQNLVQKFLPIFTQGLNNNSQSSNGAAALLNVLSKNHSGSILNQLSQGLSDETSIDGGKILGHVLGSKLTAVNALFSKDSNLDATQIAKIFQLATPILMGMLGSKIKQSNLDASSLSGLLSQSISEAQATDPKNMGFINQLFDQDGDSSISDDLANTGLSMFKSWMSGRK